MNHIVCESPSDFEATLEQAESAAAAEGVDLYLYFTGAKDASSGISWCGDCTRAEPIVKTAMKNISAGCVFVEFIVDRSEYRQKDYKYRTEPSVQLKCVPTLFKRRRGKNVVSLDDNQCQVEQNVLDLIEA